MFIFFRAKTQTFGGHAIENLAPATIESKQIFAEQFHSNSKVRLKGCVNSFLDFRESLNLTGELLRETARGFTPVLLSEGEISFDAKYGREDLMRVKRGIWLH